VIRLRSDVMKCGELVRPVTKLREDVTNSVLNEQECEYCNEGQQGAWYWVRCSRTCE
jgi:hypothetical protein